MTIEEESKKRLEEGYKLNKIEFSLRKFAFNDIIKVSAGDNVIATFILCSCFIEQLATFRYGKEVGKKEFEDFSNEYLKDYNSKSLREDLRNRLVHNYSLGESYTLIQRYSELHLKPNEGTVFLNLENFISDLEKALNALMNQIRYDPQVRQNALIIYDKINIISGSAITISLTTSLNPIKPDTINE